jgi:hypothetical protein
MGLKKPFNDLTKELHESSTQTDLSGNLRLSNQLMQFNVQSWTDGENNFDSLWNSWQR